MTRLTAAVLGVSGILLVFHESGAAQQPALTPIQATRIAELRVWDDYVTRAERAGDLRIQSSTVDPAASGRRIDRLQQFYRGVRVWGADVVRQSEGGAVQWLFGAMSSDIAVAVNTALPADAARSRLLAAGGDSARLVRSPELVVLPLTTGGYRLAYTAVISAKRDVFRVFVDASSGEELLRYTSLHTQAAIGTGRGVLGDLKKLSVLRSGGLFVTADQQRPPALTTFDMRGDLLRALEVMFDGRPLVASDLAYDTDNSWTDGVAVDAHAYVGWTYDYFFKRHARHGLDDHDRPIVALINGATQLDTLSLPPELLDFAFNAFWCGECGPAGVGLMYFGNGMPSQYAFSNGQNIGYLAGSLDVVAHELTHGVTDSSSRLMYLGESGALNESFSDIMGTAVEFFHQPRGTGLGEADFLIGEDAVRSFTGGHGVRSLSNPGAFGDPDHYSRRYTGDEDNGGVHTNSGIPNHAFYLAVVGGPNRTSGLIVEGVGVPNMAQIERVFYRAFVHMLPASSSFSMARAATIQAARDLYGPGSPAERSITQAWTAVGVF